MTNVPHPKKKGDNWGEPTHETKDKHQIKKIPSVLIIDILIKIKNKYGILPYVGLMPVPCNLYITDDPPVG